VKTVRTGHENHRLGRDFNSVPAPQLSQTSQPGSFAAPQTGQRGRSGIGTPPSGELHCLQNAFVAGCSAPHIAHTRVWPASGAGDGDEASGTSAAPHFFQYGKA
jgi:hypothetical protein